LSTLGKPPAALRTSRELLASALHLAIRVGWVHRRAIKLDALALPAKLIPVHLGSNRRRTQAKAPTTENRTTLTKIEIGTTGTQSPGRKIARSIIDDGKITRVHLEKGASRTYAIP
jgi:hypothetical protein